MYLNSRYEKHIGDNDPDKDNFYSIIEMSKDLI